MSIPAACSSISQHASWSLVLSGQWAFHICAKYHTKKYKVIHCKVLNFSFMLSQQHILNPECLSFVGFIILLALTCPYQRNDEDQLVSTDVLYILFFILHIFQQKVSYLIGRHYQFWWFRLPLYLMCPCLLPAKPMLFWRHSVHHTETVLCEISELTDFIDTFLWNVLWILSYLYKNRI